METALKDNFIIQNRSKRDPNIELLRIVLMFMIVCFHLFSFYIQEGAFYGNQPMYITKLTFTSLTAMAVDCFVFISGYYGMKFKLRQIVSLIIQAVFYSYLCLVILFFVSPNLIDSSFILKYLLPISSSVWWFLSGYFLLYIISPFLNFGVQNLTKKHFQILLFCFLYFNCFSNFIYDLEFGGNLLNFIFIYLLGRYISTYGIEIKKPFILFLVFFVIMFLLNFIVGKFLDKPILFASRYSSVLTIASAICFFFTFKQKKKIKCSNWVFKIAPLCFGVYLAHFNYLSWNIVIHPFLFKIDTLYKHNQMMFILSTLVLGCLIFVICLFIEKIRQILCNPLLNFIDKKLDKLNLNV